MNNPDFISVSTFAVMLGCSTRTVRRMIKRGVIAARRARPACKIWIARDDARRFIDTMKQDAPRCAREAAGMKQR